MSKVRVIEALGRRQLGEGPLWSPRRNALYMTDILQRQVWRLDLASELARSWVLPEMVGWVIERRDHDGFIGGLQSGFKYLDLDEAGGVAIQALAEPEPDRIGNRMNDAKADSAGAIWAGTMPLGADRPSGAFYHLSPSREVRRIDDGYAVANGPAFSPDERFVYHTDSVKGLVYRFAVQGPGLLGPREVFIAFESGWGSPDGMTVDADGGLWIAHWGGSRISRFHDDGRLDRSIELPASQITSCCFAGDQLDRLFVTSAADGLTERLGGAVFEVETGRRGLAPCAFGG